MHRTTALGLLAGATLALAGCTSSSHSTTAHSTTPATVAAAPTTTAATEPPIPQDSKLATGAATAACWKAIRDQYTPGTAQLTGAPTTPPECAGLSTDEVSAIAEDVIEHQLG